MFYLIQIVYDNWRLPQRYLPPPRKTIQAFLCRGNKISVLAVVESEQTQGFRTSGILSLHGGWQLDKYKKNLLTAFTKMQQRSEKFSLTDWNLDDMSLRSINAWNVRVHENHPVIRNVQTTLFLLTD